MRKSLLLFFILSAPFSLTLKAEPSPLLFEENNSVIINNRILLKIQDKPVTVVDVVKKMDLYFYQQYPHLVSNLQARYEFYKVNFQAVFSSLINDLLIVADAEEKEIETTDGDVREEMETLFGPDVVANVDKLGFAYDEAWNLVKRELIVRKMSMMMVRSKAIGEVYPKAMKVIYQDYTQANPPAKEWVYQVLQIRGKEKGHVESASEKAYQLLAKEATNISQLPQLVQVEAVEVNLSEEFVRGEKEISVLHKEALQFLSPLGCSPPMVQLSPKEGGYSAKMFVLKEIREKKPSSFIEMENQIQQELLQKAMARHNNSYTEKLRERYGITEGYLSQMIPKDFVPFQIR